MDGMAIREVREMGIVARDKGEEVEDAIRRLVGRILVDESWSTCQLSHGSFADWDKCTFRHCD